MRINGTCCIGQAAGDKSDSGDWCMGGLMDRLGWQICGLVLNSNWVVTRSYLGRKKSESTECS
jgi:hypothetical protein